jgi:DNA-binding NtrC family response regulator
MVSVLWVKNDGDDFRDAQRLTPCQVTTAAGPFEALEMLRKRRPDAMWITLPLEGCPADALLEEALRCHRDMPVVFELPQPDLAAAVNLLKKGAFHVLEQESAAAPVIAEIAEYNSVRRRGADADPEAASNEPWRCQLVGNSRGMKNILQIIRLVGKRRSTVLVTGETGTGKEVVARALHLASDRGHLPMIAVNCSAFPENLLESELFGHVRGAYTGAFQNRVGRFEQAHRSTLFLDEIGDMPVDLQCKLLRVLQEREIQRLGSSDSIHLDVRVIAATNVDLAERIRQGKFREDLYYRLNVVPVSMPPLRERLGDLPLLVHHFLEKICTQEDLPTKQVRPETLRRLTQYSWPGNVRELENRVEMAVALSGDREMLYPADFDLPSGISWKPAAHSAVPLIAVPDDGLDFEQTVGRIERNLLEQALQKSRGNKKLAAEMLRLKRTTLSAKLKSIQAVAG